jgi:hypothetical protein
MPEHRSAGGPPAGPPAARWRGFRRAREAAALSLAALLFLASCASAPIAIKPSWETVPAAKVHSDYCLFFDCAINPKPENIRVSGNQLFNGSKALTPVFVAIDSYDVSLERKEIVFSAKRKDNFDVGLVSMDGSDIHWIPEDPADETNVSWAPRGNKVSYILHTSRGSIVRTVHIPTATPLSVDLPDSEIDVLIWEPKAERFALVLESPDVSWRLVSMTYAGEKREEVIHPSDRLDVSLEPIGGVLVMRPNAMRYNEKLPLVVWFDDKPFAWSDARAALMRNARVAIAIAPKFSDGFWREIRNVPWLDTNRTYSVGSSTIGSTSITGDPDIAPHRYVRRGNTLLVPSAVVQSFAAAFIADDLKGTPPPNGRR